MRTTIRVLLCVVQFAASEYAVANVTLIPEAESVGGHWTPTLTIILVSICMFVGLGLLAYVGILPQVHHPIASPPIPHGPYNLLATAYHHLP